MHPGSGNASELTATLLWSEAAAVVCSEPVVVRSISVMVGGSAATTGVAFIPAASATAANAEEVSAPPSMVACDGRVVVISAPPTDVCEVPDTDVTDDVVSVKLRSSPDPTAEVSSVAMVAAPTMTAPCVHAPVSAAAVVCSELVVVKSIGIMEEISTTTAG